MSNILMLIPTDINVGVNIILSALCQAINEQSIIVKKFTPIFQSIDDSLDIKYSISISDAETFIKNNQKDKLMEQIVKNFFHIKNSKPYDNNQLILVEGLIPYQESIIINLLNSEIAKTLNAKIIFLSFLIEESITYIKSKIELAYIALNKPKYVQGLIINQLKIDFFKLMKTNINLSLELKNLKLQIPILGFIPNKLDLIYPLGIEVSKYINANIINEGNIHKKYIKNIFLYSGNWRNLINSLKNESLIITDFDQKEIFSNFCQKYLITKDSSILLTNTNQLNLNINTLYKKELPILTVNKNIWEIIINLYQIPLKLLKTQKLINNLIKYINNYIDKNWLKSLKTTKLIQNNINSPYIFRYKLINLAQKANKNIILPEGNEPRTIKAATICNQQGIANCSLLGNPEEIHNIANIHNIVLNNINIINPKLIKNNYIHRLVELRKHKGMTEELADQQLNDNVILGTLMLEKGEVDGLVSGAVHTTANTLRPSLQLIKTNNFSTLISSIFFMLLPEKILIYGDCAINTDPTAEQLAEIAIQSVNTASAFGLEQRVAMVSYATGNSGYGHNVDKVRKATLIVNDKRPDIIIDGPLQYDAAIIANVAKLKAPKSPIAGNANIIIFPDLTSGNITYKAVQRSTNSLAIGPILQGIKKPVNDLSRGALIEDIVYTIAITAIQAHKL